MADRQVQQALAVQEVSRTRECLATLRWDRDAQLPLPEVHPGTAGHDIIWQRPRGHRLHQMLTNPCEAGALVYGRTEIKTVIEDGRARRVHGGQSHWSSGASCGWRSILATSAGTCFSRTTSSWRPIAPCQQRPVELPNEGRRCAVALRCGRCGRKLRLFIVAPQGACHGMFVGAAGSTGAPRPLDGRRLRVDPAVTAAGLEALQPAGGPGGVHGARSCRDGP